MSDDEIKKLLENKYPAQAKLFIIGLVIVVIVGISGFAYMKHQQNERAVVLTEQQAADIKTLSEKLHVSEKTAAQISAQRAKQPEVVYSYSVQAKTAQEVAETTRKEIDAGTNVANKISADRTLIVPKEQEYKVEVSRIQLAPKIIKQFDLDPGFKDGRLGLKAFDVSISRRVSESGKYIGVHAGYDLYDQKAKFGLRGTF